MSLLQTGYASEEDSRLDPAAKMRCVELLGRCRRCGGVDLCTEIGVLSLKFLPEFPKGNSRSFDFASRKKRGLLRSG
jgi:hypothetical protein